MHGEQLVKKEDVIRNTKKDETIVFIVSVVLYGYRTSAGSEDGQGVDDIDGCREDSP